MRATASERMVGREAELRLLLEAFEDARAGTPRTVIVRGEAGIGKSRLLHELQDRARELEPEVVTATGQCVEVGTIGAPFTPVRRLLRELADTLGPDTLRTAADSPHVTATLATLLPDLRAETDAPTGQADFVTEAVERVVEALSHEHHLLLVIEDLHWADSATLDLLRTLAVTLRGSHVLLVMTYRSEDVGRGHPLRPVLAELDRSRLVSGVELERLTPQQVVEQAAQIAGGLDREAVEAVVQRSEGVPFFVEELIALAGERLPDTLRGLVLARYDRLSETARDVVGVVAAGGVHVSHDVLDEVYPGDAAALRDGVREAVAANVLIADEAGYGFRHALIHEAVHDELLPSERAALHHRYAEAADARTRAGDLTYAAFAAEHWLQARDLPRAFDAIVLARRHAEDTLATTAAVGFAEQLLEIWPQVPDAAERAGIDAASLHIELARLCTGDPARSLRVSRAGLRGDVDTLTRAQLLAEGAAALHNLGRITDFAEQIADAVDLLDESVPTHRPTLARLFSLQSGLPASMVGGVEERQRIAERALVLAESIDDPEIVSIVLANASWAQSDAAALDEALATIRRASALDVPAPDRFHACLVELDTLVRLGRFAEAVELGEPAVQEASALGLERWIGAKLAANVAEAHLGLGTAARAMTLLDRCRTLLSNDPMFQSFALRQLALARTWDGDLGGADDLRRREASRIAEAQSEDPEERIGWAELDCEHALALLETADDAGERARLLETAAAAALTLAEPDFLAGPGVSRRLLAGAARAYAEARLAGRKIDGLRTTVETATAAQPDDAPGRALRLLIAAELLRAEAAEGADPADAWRVAVESPDIVTLPVRHRHYASYRWASAIASSGRHDDAAEVLAPLPAASSADGVALVGRWAADLARRIGVTDRAGGGAAVGPDAHLTPRERQVLELVAQGLTNREIGERLFISHKTASVHVSAILAKIGARSRAEAAAIHGADAQRERT